MLAQLDFLGLTAKPKANVTVGADIITSLCRNDCSNTQADRLCTAITFCDRFHTIFSLEL